MKVLLNGNEVELTNGATVNSALETLEFGGAPLGVAVAVDAEVVPRSEWGSRRLSEGARVEVLRAIQGG